MTSSNTNTALANKSSVDEIDLGQVLRSLGRYRLLIASISTVSVLLSAYSAFSRKPVWEGQFQIVLEQKDSGTTGRLGQLAASNPLLANLAGLSGGSDSQLETEVKVLESPLVLNSTYEFVKASKAKAGINVSNWTFRGWRNRNLEIELEKGTSVLNIAYRDTDRDLVLPVIERISKDYQLYSGRDRSKSIRNGLSFAKEQIKQFRKQAATSSRALDAFSIRYGIASSGAPVGSSGIDLSKLLNSGASARSFIPLNSLNSLSSSNSARVQGDALGKLAAINQELIRRQQHFTSRDPGVIALIRERDALRRYIEVTAGGSLTLPGQEPLSKEQAQELILQFEELKRTAMRDLAALDSLESSLLALQLEQARQSDPWELITAPTLLEQPVAPRKSRIVAFGLLAGLLAGSGAALIADRRTGIVFSIDELKVLLPCPLLKHLPAYLPAAWSDTADLLATGPLSTAGNSPIALIPVGKVPTEQVRAFTAELGRALGDRELIVSSDLRQTSACSTQLLLTAPGIATRTQISQLKQKLALQGTSLAGWVLLDPELKLN